MQVVTIKEKLNCQIFEWSLVMFCLCKKEGAVLGAQVMNPETSPLTHRNLFYTVKWQI